MAVRPLLREMPEPRMALTKGQSVTVNIRGVSAPRQKKQWKDFTPVQQKAMIAGAVVQVSLLVAAQIDLSRRTAEEVRGPKALWRILAFVNFVGPLAYFAFGRRR